jgi:hypothetical protein
MLAPGETPTAKGLLAHTANPETPLKMYVVYTAAFGTARRFTCALGLARCTQSQGRRGYTGLPLEPERGRLGQMPDGRCLVCRRSP